MHHLLNIAMFFYVPVIGACHLKKITTTNSYNKTLMNIPIAQ